ncbi:TadE/TadG family type IV pilus assembly protein [Alteraurantiacibacter buctensis]|uniref:Pilus assembly protein n=1 Tax=Alteraurantiacibacter buctensis TaxID=1503981 RepID=A0A844Z2T4_9SPHN|nr:TadE/TadG family type IV pilus assembly protein [Alteraurantiacibacter buctensis]MXO73516.1 pilus assembly protein [Alteraurantiacibacter buctensis]
MTEFALVFPVFLLFLFGAIEGCRLMWSQQVLETAAYETARCMSVSSSCATVAGREARVVTEAANVGLTITASAATMTTGTTCRGHANSNKVTIQTPFSTVLRGFLPMPTTIEATACFPVITLS